MRRRSLNRLVPALAAICTAWCAEPLLRIPPVAAVVDLEGQPVRFTVSGDVFESAADGGRESIRVELHTDLEDFARHLTPILAAQMNQSNRCGERLTLLDARLIPAAPAALLTATAHVEKWGCAKAFGKEIVKKLVAGDGVLSVRLTPQLEDGGGVKLAAEVTSIQADGSLGELLRSGSFADAIREKIRAAVVSAIQKSTDFKKVIPPAFEDLVSIRSVEFADAGEGRLALAFSSEVRVPARQAREMIERLQSPAR